MGGRNPVARLHWRGARYDSRVTIFVVGLILLVSAWALYYADRNAVFLDQLALAVHRRACAVAVATLEDAIEFQIAAALLVLQLAVLTSCPTGPRTLAALFATMAWVYTVRFAMFSGHGDDFLRQR
jgi:hypothetical protein